MRLIGIDGCPDGWLVAESDEELRPLTFRVERAIQPLFELASSGQAWVVIDIPIGLPNRGARACDLLARRLVGGRRSSSVFPAPPRIALRAIDDYRRCCELVKAQNDGVSISRQAHALLRKIKEVDDLITPELQAWVREGHPEVTFATLAGRSLRDSKKTPGGRRERLEILRRQGVVIRPVAERLALRPARVEIDDIVDAAACLLTARRLQRGFAMGATDAKGLRMEISA